MKYSTVLVGLLTIFGLSACERPTVVNTPPASTTTVVPGPTVVEPGPAGPPGTAGPQGAPGTTGEPGAPGGVVIVPVPSEQK